MKITKLFEIILILAILCILFKIFYSMSYKICKLYRSDIKKRLALKDEKYIYFFVILIHLILMDFFLLVLL